MVKTRIPVIYRDVQKNLQTTNEFIYCKPAAGSNPCRFQFYQEISGQLHHKEFLLFYVTRDAIVRK